MKRLLCLFCIVFAFNSMQGQNISLGGGGGSSSMDSTKNFRFLPIPYINYNRSTGLALGLLPMAIGFGDGAEVRTPMAVTVIFGLLFSTVLTLIVLPVLYSLFDRKTFITPATDSEVVYG